MSDAPRADYRGRAGQRGEHIAAAYLQRRGYRVLDRNVRRREGEIDLVAEHDGTLVFVEVKLRRPGAMGGALEALTEAKQRRLLALAAAYAAEHPALPSTLRIDLIAIDLGPGGRPETVQHIESAVED